ncbi:MAG: hypothetical protein K1X78_08805 [Verrucomicrobiaceae bacterium]|nr:hypothetical protein [Verrucomicrobiaceae bacterium]
MPDDSPSSSWFSSLPLPGVLAVFSAVVGTLLVQYQPLTPRRPAENGQGAMPNLGQRKIDATLLEDPFAVINRVTLLDPPGVKAASSAVSPGAEVRGAASGGATPGAGTRRFVWTPDELKEEVQQALKRCPEDPPGKTGHRHEILVMPVLVRPFSDVASSEMRARMRQATTAALFSSGYSMDNRRIDCLRLPDWQPDGADSSMAGSAAEVPFEWADPTEHDDPHPGDDPAISDTRYARVLVLWVRNDLIGRQGIARLREFCDMILPKDKVEGPTGKQPNLAVDHLIVRVLGPSSTEALGKLVKDARDNKHAKDAKDMWQHCLGRMPVPVEGRWPGLLTLVSARATGSAMAVLAAALSADDIRALDEQARERKGPLPDDYLASQLTAQPPSGVVARPTDPPLFMRTMPTDAVVARALKQELVRRLRGRAPWLEDNKSAELSDAERRLSEQSHVVLISEFDSTYGRGLPPLLVGPTKTVVNETTDPWLHTFSYARGLDGSLHQPASGKGDGDGKKTGDRTKEDYRPDEMPVGLNQIDALRRLAVQIEELDDRLQKETDGASVVAVGILGSDIYDKLLILRALRPRLKDAVFFTNNLDAWFWQKDELPNTRNLVVACSYGLSLNERFQRGVLPFRDSYQTGDFAGALAALGVIPPKVFSDVFNGSGVRLFEIGKDLPYDLSLEAGPDDEATRLHPPRADRTSWWMNPDRRPFRWPVILLFPLVIGLAGLMAVIEMIGVKGHAVAAAAGAGHTKSGDPAPDPDTTHGSESAGSTADTSTRRRVVAFCGQFGGTVLRSTPTWIVLGLPCFAFGTYKLWRFWRVDGEPYAWWSGLSAWPSEVLRLLAASLAVHFTIKAALDLRDLNTKMEENFDLEAAPPDQMAGTKDAAAEGQNPAAQSSLEPLVRRALWLSTGAEDVQQVWRDFKERSRLKWRAARCLPMVVLLAVLSWMLTCVMDPGYTANVRGLGPAWFDWWCDLASHLSLVVVTAFVADALWLNRSLVMRIGKDGCKWSKSFQDKFKGRPIHRDLLGSWLDLRFIAARTAEAGRVTFYPFYLLGLLVLARLDGFDHWTWPPGLVCAYLGFALIVMTIALLVRNEAEALRAKALLALDHHIDAGTAGNPDHLSTHRAGIVGLRAGAFAPLSGQPAVRVIFWALGTAGAGGLWQYLTRLLP